MGIDGLAPAMNEVQDLTDLELMFQSAPIGMCCLDTDLRYLRINAVLAAINGRPVSEHIGRTLREVLPEIAPTLEPAFHEVLESGKPMLNVEVQGRVPSEPAIERYWICNYYPLVSPEGAVRGIATTVQEITERTVRDQAQHELLRAISQAHSGFILGEDPRTLFDGLLRELLSLTESEYGFIGEILRTPAGDPYLKTSALTDIAWNEETRAFYDASAPSGSEFVNLDTLFGAVITTEETVISNEPSKDLRRSGTPEALSLSTTASIWASEAPCFMMTTILFLWLVLACAD